MKKLISILALIALAACAKPAATDAPSTGDTSRAIVQEVYAGFEAGDMDKVTGVMAADIVWNEAEGNPYADNNPYVGPEAVLTGLFARLGGEWDGFAAIPSEFVAEDDRVIVFGRYSGTYKATGKSMDAPFVHSWTVKDGKISSFQQYTDTAEHAGVMAQQNSTAGGRIMEFEAFRVIAQIAAGLSGFVGILVVLQDRLARLPRRQMLGFLQRSIGTLAFALLPDFVFSLPIAPEIGWQVLGGLFGAYHLFIFVFFLSGYGDFRKMPPIQIGVCIASIPVIGAKLLLGFGLFAAYAPNIYHLGLLWTIGVSIFFFVQVILNEASDDA